MKKSLVALAALAVAGAASAQSSVTLFGIVDAAVGHYSIGDGGLSATKLVNSGYNSSRLGFRGVEDLGGGLSASFWLEGALSNDDGTPAGLQFQRRSTVSLSGGFGEIRLGRDYTPTFWNDTVFDPFGTNGVGTNVFSSVAGSASAAAAAQVAGNGAGQAIIGNVGVNNPNYVRSSNTIGYFLPSNLGGFYGQVQYGFHEQTAGSAGGYKGLRFGYAAGPVDVALAWGKTDGAATPTAAAPDVTTWNLGGSYDLGAVKLFGEYGALDVDTGAGGSADVKGWLLGATAPVGAGLIRASWSQGKLDVAGDPKATKLALGYVHNLSKRTALYATYARIQNKNGAALGLGSVVNTTGGNATGYEFGVRHSF